MIRNSLRQKIASLVIWVGLVSALVIGGVVFWYLNNNSIAGQEDRIAWETSGHAQQAALIFKNNQLFVKLLGGQTYIKDFLLNPSKTNKKKVLDFLSSYAKEDKKYLAIFLMDKTGLALVSTDSRFVNQNYGFRDYFKKALRGEPSVEGALGKTSKQFGYYYSYPVFDDNNNIIGVLAVKVDVGDIESYLLTDRVAKSGVVMLTNELGIVIASNQKNRIYRSLGALTEQEQLKLKMDESFLGQEILSLQYDQIQRVIRNYKGQQIIKIYDQEDNTTETISISRIAGLPFFLVIEDRLNVLVLKSLVTVAVVLFIVLIGLVIELFFIYYILSIFFRPLKSLQVFSKKIGRGDFSKKIKIKTNDEFSDLADSFNKMSDDLNDLYKNLDKKVKEKTKDSEKFKLAVENASDHIVITDKDGAIIFANRAMEEITGFKIKEVVGKKVGSKQLWGGEMDKAFYEKLWKTVKVDKKPFNGEIRNHRKNGELYIAKVSISPVLDKMGEVMFFAAIERDITREKMIDKAKSEFVSLASHQLRTPLSAIKWTLEALGQDSGLTAKHKERISDVYSANERLIALVNDLLNVSHIEEDKIVAKKELVDIGKIISESIKTFKANADKKKQTLKLSINAPIVPINLDILRFGEAFNNLVSNAINYTPGGQQIDIAVSAKSNDYLISVHNNEPIIPLSDQKKLFAKFYRGTEAQKIHTTGSGLGLFIAKAAVEQNGGKIWFESKEGKGTTFFFTVPKK